MPNWCACRIIPVAALDAPLNYEPRSLAACHAFLLGGHERSGSFIKKLSPDLVKKILVQVRKPVDESAIFLRWFLDAYTKGVWGREGASKMSGTFLTNANGSAGEPRAVWDAQLVKGHKAAGLSAHVYFAAKWQPPFADSDYKRISKAFPNLVLTIDHAEQGMGIFDRIKAANGRVKHASKDQMTRIMKKPGFRRLIAHSG